MRKRLTKSSNNIVITGTLGGVGEYLNIDPTIIRIIFIAMCFSGFPIFLYIIAAMVMPSGKGNQDTRRYNNYYGEREQRYYGERKTNNRPRKEAEKVDEDEWSDF